MLKYLLKFKDYFEVVLIIAIGIITSFQINDSVFLISHLLLLILLSISLEYLLNSLTNNETSYNFKNIKIAIIIFLISAGHTNIFLLAFAVIVSHISLRYVKNKNIPIFNPVTLGVFSLSLFGLKVTWWGINNGSFIILFMVISGILINYYNKSLREIALYLLFTLTFSFIFTFNPLYSIKQLFVPGFLFFSLYIFPLNLKFLNNRLIIYYTAIAPLIAVTIPKFGIFTDPLITSLVLTDFFFFARKFFGKSNHILNPYN